MRLQRDHRQHRSVLQTSHFHESATQLLVAKTDNLKYFLCKLSTWNLWDMALSSAVAFLVFFAAFREKDAVSIEPEH